MKRDCERFKDSRDMQAITDRDVYAADLISIKGHAIRSLELR